MRLKNMKCDLYFLIKLLFNKYINCLRACIFTFHFERIIYNIYNSINLNPGNL